MIRTTPSAVNLQPWKVKIVNDNNLKQELAPHIPSGQTQALTCSHMLILCANIDWESHIEKTIENMKKAYASEESLKYYQMVVNAMFTRAPNSDKRIIESQKNVFLAAASAVFGAKSLGIDSCIIQGFNVDAVSKTLKLKSNLIPTLIITLGYAVDSPSPKNRLPEEDIFF
ncbi:nitroreductase family protein [uncultured Methanomethylovorans sp.]|uniref:nitroreductase family protein n=1 Tax=uncultured Methanomethylovorans sp. TaxID=183759 RepID=UPI002AA857D2|nr:nitroreductase family protein [uncultured Methanomethylovorans sp.]